MYLAWPRLDIVVKSHGLLVALVRSSLLLVVALFVWGSVGCSSTPKVAVPPSPLTQYEQVISFQRLWRHSLGGETGAAFAPLIPAIYADVVYTATRDGGLQSISLLDGKLHKQIAVDEAILAGVAVSSEILAVGTNKGNLLAFDPATMQPLWSAFVGGELISAPVIASGTLLARTVNGKLYALSVATGKVRWIYERPPPSLSLRGNSRPVVANGVVFIGLDTGRVAALRLTDGVVLWETMVASGRGRTEIERIIDIDADPLYRAGRLFVAVYQDRVVALDTQNGRQFWERDFSTVTNMAMDGSSLFAISQDGEVWAFSQATGSTLWRQQALRGRSLSTPVVFASSVCVGDFEGYFHCMDSADGTLQGRINLASKAIAADPLLFGDDLLVLALDGTLIRLTPVLH